MSKFEASELSNCFVLRKKPSICYRTNNLLLQDLIYCKKILEFARLVRSQKKFK